jgi:hypothetical protein
MDPHNRFCHNQRCWAYGRAGEGHIVIHSQRERRYKCKRCKKTFSETKGSQRWLSCEGKSVVGARTP